MKTVCVSQRINVPAQSAWDLVRTGAAMDRWMPAVTACHLEGSGVGARRVCVISGHELHETIETVDDSSRLFQYRIQRQSLLPVREVLGTIHVSAAGSDSCEVLWFVNFELDSAEAWDAVKAGIEDLYRAGITGLAAAAQGAAPSRPAA